MSGQEQDREALARRFYERLGWSGCAGSRWELVSEYRTKWYEIADVAAEVVREAEQRGRDEMPLSLMETQQIVEHLMKDGTRSGLILADRLNSAMGASARRRIARHAGADQ